MGLGADAEPRRSLDPDNLVMPSKDQIKNFQVVRSSGPWETTGLVKDILNQLANLDKLGLTPPPFTLEDIGSSAKLRNPSRGTNQSSDGESSPILALKKGEWASLDDLIRHFAIDSSQPHAACPDLFGEVSERVGIWSLGVAVIRSVTGMSEDQVRRFWSIPEIILLDNEGKYPSPKKEEFDFDSLRKEYPTLKPYLPWLQRALSVEADTRFNSISEASAYWDTAVLKHPSEASLPKGEKKVVRGWSFTGTRFSKDFEGNLSLDCSGRFFCVAGKGVVKVFEISAIPNVKSPFTLVFKERLGDFGTSSIDWRGDTVSGTTEQGQEGKIDIAARGETGHIWMKDHLKRNDQSWRKALSLISDFDLIPRHGTPEDKKDFQRRIKEMRESEAWAEKNDRYQISGSVDIEPNDIQVCINANLRADDVKYILPKIKTFRRGPIIKPFCTARWCGFVVEESDKSAPATHLFLIDRPSSAIHRRNFSFSDFEVNRNYLVGVEQKEGSAKVTVIW
jgi:hypothetical protein